MPIGTANNFAFPVLTTPSFETALADVTMPFADMAVAGSDDAQVTLVVTAVRGKLSADPAAGAVVSGSGTPTVWIGGTIDQVDAELATLTYAYRPGLYK